jgi:hypothetical protein
MGLAVDVQAGAQPRQLVLELLVLGLRRRPRPQRLAALVGGETGVAAAALAELEQAEAASGSSTANTSTTTAQAARVMQPDDVARFVQKPPGGNDGG